MRFLCREQRLELAPTKLFWFTKYEMSRTQNDNGHEILETNHWEDKSIDKPKSLK